MVKENPPVRTVTALHGSIDETQKKLSDLQQQMMVSVDCATASCKR